ncbi:Abi family protein [Agrococcus lahaulensis]|nr:Abi family protein [Agrococcus lahaulensis]
MHYSKPWLSIDEQLARLAERGADIEPRDDAGALLRAVGYYRLTGYLYPFRESERVVGDDGKTRVRVLGHYRAGTSVHQARELIDFDRDLRLLVLEALERIEVSLRVQFGHELGRRSPFAHLESEWFVSTFTDAPESVDGAESPHQAWLRRVQERLDGSDEAFVAHFREKYDGRMPIWAVTEVLEFGQLSRLYGGLRNDLATTIATSFGVPSKRVMASWIASLNYVRNVAAHHARLFNRKLVVAPQRPRRGVVPVLDHLRDETRPKSDFGLYNALAVTAYLLRAFEPESGWPERLTVLMDEFPSETALSTASMGFPANWRQLALWQA